MRRILCFMLVLLPLFATAQTLNINMGDVTYAISAAQAGEMAFANGQMLTVGGKTYLLSDITSIVVNEGTVADNTVGIAYNGSSAKVTVAGNIAPYLSVAVRGAHVAVVADEKLPDEVTYTLSGSSSDGSFYMDGSKKAVFVLNGVSLNNPDSAAVNIQCGKKISVVLADGTSNSLTDGVTGTADDSDSHKAALYINGHSSWSGKGTLTLQGRVKHGLCTDEYIELEEGVGSITVSSSVSDGFHINEYLLMKGGVVSISSGTDGVDVGKKNSSTDAQNGQLLITGGTLSVVSAGYDVKGLKSEGAMTISGGTVNVTMTGGGSKGISATGDLLVSGGKTTVVTTGAVYTVDGDEKKPHGVKSDANITLSGGEIYVAASADEGRAFSPADTAYLYTNGATLMGIGGKATTPSGSSTNGYQKYKDVNVTAGSTLTYDGVSFTVPNGYNNSSAKILVSK